MKKIVNISKDIHPDKLPVVSVTIAVGSNDEARELFNELCQRMGRSIAGISFNEEDAK